MLRMTGLPLSRRSFAAACAVSAATSFAGKAWADPLRDTEVLAAPTTASIILARLIDSGALASVFPNAGFGLWHDPDELRAAIVSKRVRLFTSPTHVPANLANRGMPLKLVSILGMGHLVVVTSDRSISRFADLAGKKVLGFFRRDMPDLVFRAVAKMEGLDPDKDIQISYVGTPMEAAQMIAAGRAETAILSEPSASAAIMMAARQGRELVRAINLQDIWMTHHGGMGIPMVGLCVHASALDEAPDLLPLLRENLPRAKDWVLANMDAAAALAERAMHIKQPIFRASLDHAPLVVLPAKAARPSLEAFYRAILELSPDTLAGRLPADDFYLDT